MSGSTSPVDLPHSPHSPRGRSQSIRRDMEQSERPDTADDRHYMATGSISRRYNSPVDLRLLDYVTEYDDNLMCAICRCPFIDPVILKDCDHCFCKECIEQTWLMTAATSVRNACPSCRVPISQGVRRAGKVLNNILDDLVVKCPHADEGCDAELKRAEAQDHVNLYCQHALVECPEEHCARPVRRKHVHLPCQHSMAGCLECQKELWVADLDAHWRVDCPVRTVACGRCDETMAHSDLEPHLKMKCQYAETPCPGTTLGCEFRGQRALVDAHIGSCTFAKIAPIILKQNRRLEEQEAAQKDMARKLVILEDGFSAIQGIFRGRAASPDVRGSAETAIAFQSGRSQLQTPADHPSWPERTSSARASSTSAAVRVRGRATESRELPADNPHMSMPIGYDLGDRTWPLSPDEHAPYTSPLDHLLSMHESLREEVSRISTALQEVDGRHSMQNLNENLRTRDEITYLGAQVAGLSRQVQWLTSAQLQRQQTPRMTTSGSSSGSAGPSDAGAGVEAAVNAVNAATTYIRNATQSSNNTGSGTLSRRGSSAEGRTKL